MKANVILLFLFIFTLLSCSDEVSETTKPFVMYTQKGIVIAQLDSSETKAFELINEVNQEVIAVRIYGNLHCTLDSLSESQLRNEVTEFGKRPFCGYVNIHSKEVINFSFGNMLNKEYQQEWLDFKKRTGLKNDKETILEVLFKVPEGDEKSWIEKLSTYPSVISANVPFICVAPD